MFQAFHPELYLLPGVESIDSPSLSSPERPSNNAECVLAYASNHKPHSSPAPDHGVDQNPTVLETSLKNNFSQMQEKGRGFSWFCCFRMKLKRKILWFCI